MGQTREIKGRMKAVANIRRITKTMQMIATARFQYAQRKATASKPFARKIGELAGELAAAMGGDNAALHPLLRTELKAGGRELLLVITSNRGLCGGYNANVLRTANAYRRAQVEAGRTVDLELAGKKGVAFFRFSRVEVSKFHSQFTDKVSFEEVEPLATRYMKHFSDGEYDAVKVAYMAFESMGRQSAQVLTLLPLSDPRGGESRPESAGTQYDYSPDPRSLLDELLPITVKTRLFQCFNEAAVSEHIARMIAMKAATDAGGRMGRELTRKYNRARQAAITTELGEIIAGAAALE